MRIAISGAGVAGPALAYWLHRAGHEPTIVERSPTFRDGGYTIDFWGVGYEVGERMGLEGDVRAAGYDVRTLRSVDPRGHPTATLNAELFRRITNGKFTSIPRGDLARAVYATVEGKVEVVFGDVMTAIEQDRDAVHVSFDRAGDRSFDMLVGADGLHSGVRGLVFGAEANFRHDLGYRVAAFVADRYPSRDELTYVTYNAPGRQVARFSLRDDRTLFLFVYHGGETATPRDAPAWIEEISDLYVDAGWECEQIVGALQNVDDLYVDTVSQIRMNRWSQGRVALIGDAAACPSLLSGEGTGLAMTEAYVLAGELQRSGTDVREALANYENLLRPFIEDKQRGALRVASAFAPRTRLGVSLRTQAMRAMRVEPVARMLLARTLRDNFALPSYPL